MYQKISIVQTKLSLLKRYSRDHGKNSTNLSIIDSKVQLLINDSFVLITHFNQYIFYSVKITRTYDYDRLECQKFDQVHAIIRPRTHFKDFHYVIHWVKVLCGLRFTRKASVDKFFSAFSVAHRWNWRYGYKKLFWAGEAYLG